MATTGKSTKRKNSKERKSMSTSSKTQDLEKSFFNPGTYFKLGCPILKYKIVVKILKDHGEDVEIVIQNYKGIFDEGSSIIITKVYYQWDSLSSLEQELL
jgi:hypothetical protein